MKNRQKVILDVDTGTDDAVALMLAAAKLIVPLDQAPLVPDDG